MKPTVNDYTQLLQDHFTYQYSLLVSNKFVPNSRLEHSNGVQTVLSGIPYPFLNTVTGCPTRDADACIQEKLTCFNQARLPFAWFINEGEGEEFMQKLAQHGFQNAGIFQGVIGPLNISSEMPALPSDYSIGLVKDQAAMAEFNDLVCANFAIEGTAKEMYRQLLWNEAKGTSPNMSHWFVRHHGKMVAAVSTLLQNDIVSFWNGATEAGHRRKGLSTAIRYNALNAARARGCTIGASYLMSDGMALGICTKFGFKPQWRFHVYVAPEAAPSR